MIGGSLESIGGIMAVEYWWRCDNCGHYGNLEGDCCIECEDDGTEKVAVMPVDEYEKIEEIMESAEFGYAKEEVEMFDKAMKKDSERFDAKLEQLVESLSKQHKKKSDILDAMVAGEGDFEGSTHKWVRDLIEKRLCEGE